MKIYKLYVSIIASLISVSSFAQSDHYTIPDTATISFLSPYHAVEGVLMTFGDTILNVFAYDTTNIHFSNACRIVKRFSYDRGATWTDIQTVFDSPVFDGNVAGGTVNGYVLIFFRNANVTTGVNHAYMMYSRDHGITFSTPSLVSLDFVDTNVAVPYSNIVQGDSGIFYQPFYGQKDSTYWGQLVPIRDSINLGTPRTVFNLTGTARPLSEFSIAYYPHKGMIAIARSKWKAEQFNSIDNGNTWNSLGVTNLGQDTITANFVDVSPLLTLTPHDSLLMNINTRRIGMPAIERYLDDEMVYINNWDSVFNNPTGWSLTGTVRRPIMSDSVFNFYGYPCGTWVNDSIFFCIITDRYKVGTSGEQANLYQLQIEYHTSLSVASVSQNGLKVNVYPCPANGIAHVDISNSFPDATQVYVYDLKGNLLCKNDLPKTLFPHFDLPTSNYLPGYYWVKVRNSSTEVIKPLVIFH